MQLGAVVLLALCIVAAVAERPKFVFYEYFSGEWDVTHIESTWKTLDLQNVLPGVIRFDYKRQNDTELPLLSGVSFINQTETYEKLEEKVVEM
jgi:hypothetical protein